MGPERRTNVWLPAIVAGAILASAAAAGGKDYYVSPEGTAAGEGSRARPLDLATALSAKSPARPGDTVWLLGGTYRGKFTSRLKGTAEAPITIRQAPGARATIDCRTGQGDALFTVDGEHTWFWGFEVTCSDPKRATKIAGSHPIDIRRGQIHCIGSHIRFINLIVHDLACGFGIWSGGTGGQIYGCLIYNNGWQGPDRGHGHAIYAQNKAGTKRLTDNVMFNQFGYGIHAYGSPRAFLKNFHVEGNVCFNSGSLSAGRTAPNILIGGGCPAEGVNVAKNFAWHDDLSASSVQLGYGKAINKRLTVEGNYFVGAVHVRRWADAVVRRNIFVGRGGLIALERPDGAGPKAYVWASNGYFAAGTREVFRLGGRRMALAGWRAKTGFDADSAFAPLPKATHVFCRPNRYEPGRAHVIVYNWASNKHVMLDLTAILKVGAKYKIAHAQDFFGRAVVAGTFDGHGVKVPLAPVKPAAPVGMAGAKLHPTGPKFNVFVILPTR